MGHVLLPEPMTGMMKRIARIGSSNDNSLRFSFGEEWTPQRTWGTLRMKTGGMATGQAFTAVILGNCF